MDVAGMNTTILVIRHHPRAGEDVTEFLHMNDEGKLTPVSRHEHGGLRKLGPPDLAVVLAEAKVQGITRALVDLSTATWLNSTGVGMLVAWFQAARAAGVELVFAQPSPTVIDLFKVTKLHTVFPVHDTVEEAAAKLREI